MLLFSDSFLSLIQSTKRDLHRRLLKTYGIVYEMNSEIFFDVFHNLRLYYATGSVDLADVLDEFFASLFRQIFTLIQHIQEQSTSDTYQNCLMDNMDFIRPFGNTPQKLSLRIHKLFHAARSYHLSLVTAYDVLSSYSEMVSFLLFNLHLRHPLIVDADSNSFCLPLIEFGQLDSLSDCTMRHSLYGTMIVSPLLLYLCHTTIERAATTL